MKLEDIEKLCAEAAPGPWDLIETKTVTVHFGKSMNGPYGSEDAQFIAASRTLVPKLLAVAKAAKRFIEVDAGNFPENVDQCQINNIIWCLDKLEKEE